MKEIRTIVEAYRSIDFSINKAALATVVRVEGSSYRRAGARMLVLENGRYLGGISGGCLEGDALRRAQKGIALDRSSVITYDTTRDDDYQLGVGLGCQGIIDVLFIPLHPGAPDNPLDILAGLIHTRKPALLITITGQEGDITQIAQAEESEIPGRTHLYTNEESLRNSFAPGKLAPALQEDVNKCLQEIQSRTVSYSADGYACTVFLECIRPAIQLVIYGGNYDIHPLLRMAAELGWDRTLVTNLTRADKTMAAAATRALHDKGGERPEVDPYTAILLMSHDYKTDMRNLQAALRTEASYIGLLGPRKRTQKIFEAMAAAGEPVSHGDLRRIYSPAGLDIGASNPEEIALSILAEIRSHFAGRQGMSLRLREGSIYGI